MKCVIDSIKEWYLRVYDDCDLPREFLLTLDYVADSHLNQYAHFSDGSVIQVQSGLFSGSRLTSLINTIMNMAYHKLIIE